MENIEALQAKEQFFESRNRFLTYRENKDQDNIELSRKEYLEWKDAFCKDSSDETLVAFIEIIRDEIKGKNDAWAIEYDAVVPVEDELYNRAVANMNPKATKRVTTLAKEGIHLTKYYDKCDLRGKTTLEIPKDARRPLDKYINKVLKTCTLEESVALLSFIEEGITEYIKRTFPNSYSFTRGYNIKDALTKSVKERVIEETYLKSKQEEQKRPKRLGSIFSQRKW